MDSYKLTDNTTLVLLTGDITTWQGGAIVNAGATTLLLWDARCEKCRRDMPRMQPTNECLAVVASMEVCQSHLHDFCTAKKPSNCIGSNLHSHPRRCWPGTAGCMQAGA